MLNEAGHLSNAAGDVTEKLARLAVMAAIYCGMLLYTILTYYPAARATCTRSSFLLGTINNSLFVLTQALGQGLSFLI